jgi:chemotaxis protein histidine kinase CheA
LSEDADLLEAVVDEGISILEGILGPVHHLDKVNADGDRIFHLVQSLKGSTEMMGLCDARTFSHRLESCLERVHEGNINLGRFEVSLLAEGLDRLIHLLQCAADKNAASRDADAYGHLEKAGLLFGLEPKKRQVGAWDLLGPQNDASNTPADRVGGYAQTVDQPLEMTGEMVQFDHRRRHWGQRAPVPAVNATKTQVHGIGDDYDATLQDLNASVLRMGSTGLESFSRSLATLVRAGAKDFGKHIQFVVDGADLLQDRTIIGLLKEPLAHLVRNAIEHGVEKPEERWQVNKPRVATVSLTVTEDESALTVLIRDDGAGLNLKRIGYKAIEKGLVGQAVLARMSDDETADLIFISGFSTAERVGNISARGVGMAVVRTIIEAAGGAVSLDTYTGKGTVVTLTIPKPSR